MGVLGFLRRLQACSLLDKSWFHFVTDTDIFVLPLPGKLLSQIILGCLHILVIVPPENAWKDHYLAVDPLVFIASPIWKQCSEENQHLHSVWIGLTKACNAFTWSTLWKLERVKLFWCSFSSFYSWWERSGAIGNLSSVEVLMKDGLEQGGISISIQLQLSVLQILTSAHDILRVIYSALAKLFKSEFREPSQQQIHRVSLAAL